MMKNHTLRRRITTLALTAALGISILGLGYAAWSTRISAGGSVSANGSWDVSLTGAELSASSAGATIDDAPEYNLARYDYANDARDVRDYLIVNYGGFKGTATNDASLFGTQIPGTGSTKRITSTAYLYFVDTRVYTDVENQIKGTSKSEGTAIANDPSTIALADLYSDYGLSLNKYYYPDSSYSGDAANDACKLVVNGLLRDATQLLKQALPDTYQNYALVHLYAATMSQTNAKNYVIGTMVQEAGSGQRVTYDGTTATFAPVSFSLPGAWANYSLTITNNGTADAHLSDVSFQLDTDTPDRLEVVAPDLSDTVLPAGQSCTVNVVVQVPADYEGAEIDATGTLKVTLPFQQATPGSAPTSGVTVNAG